MGGWVGDGSLTAEALLLTKGKKWGRQWGIKQLGVAGPLIELASPKRVSHICPIPRAPPGPAPQVTASLLAP